MTAKSSTLLDFSSMISADRIGKDCPQGNFMNTATNEDLSEVVLLFAERAWPNCKLEMSLSLSNPPPHPKYKILVVVG